MDFLCAGAALWIGLSLIGLLMLGGLVVLLIKLGVIVQYWNKPQAQNSSDYSLEDSKPLADGEDIPAQ